MSAPLGGVCSRRSLTTGGAYDDLTLWEQIDAGAQYTPAKKWLTSVPIGLCVIGRRNLGAVTSSLTLFQFSHFDPLHPIRLHPLCPQLCRNGLCPLSKAASGKYINGSMRSADFFIAATQITVPLSRRQYRSHADDLASSITYETAIGQLHAICYNQLRARASVPHSPYSCASTSRSISSSCCIALTSAFEALVYPSESSRTCPPPRLSLSASTSPGGYQYRGHCLRCASHPMGSCPSLRSPQSVCPPALR